MLLMTNMYDNDWAHAEYDITHVPDFPVKNCVANDCSKCVVECYLNQYVHIPVNVSEHYIGTCGDNKTNYNYKMLFRRTGPALWDGSAPPCPTSPTTGLCAGIGTTCTMSRTKKNLTPRSEPASRGGAAPACTGTGTGATCTVSLNKKKLAP